MDVSQCGNEEQRASPVVVDTKPPQAAHADAESKEATLVFDIAAAHASAETKEAAPVHSMSDGNLLSQKELRKKARAHMKKTACTVCDEESGQFKFLSVCGTSSAKLGIYGTGVQLYFQLLKAMGVCFLFLACIAAPALYFFAMGNGIDESNMLYMYVAKMSVANLGFCPRAGCKTEEERFNRCLTEDCSQKLIDVTEKLGLSDGAAVCVFMLFSLWSYHCWIPRKIREHDKKFVTCSDFSIHVQGLPRMLKQSEDHAQYEQRLRKHFQDALREYGVDDAEAVADVIAVRDYQGAISTFMNKGQIVKQLKEAQEAMRLANIAGDNKKIAVLERTAHQLECKIKRVDNSLRAQKLLSDDQRDVCTAFVTFEKEEYVQHMLHAYRLSSSSLLRLCMPKRLRFMGSRIKVKQACDPSDLYWENLDFSPNKRALRKMIVHVLTVLVMLLSTSLLVYAQSMKSVSPPTTPAAQVWIVRDASGPDSTCLQLCDMELYKSMICDASSGTSRSWTVERVFTSGGVASSEFLRGRGDCSATRLVESSACAFSSARNKTRDWIGVEFSVPAQLGCMEVTQPTPNRSRQLEMFACRSEVIPATLFEGWRPEDHCASMEDLYPRGVGPMPGASATSGPMKIRLDAKCEHTVGTEVALQAKKASTEPAQDPTLNCFCKQQVAKHGYKFRAPPYETEEEQVCQEWSENENQKMLNLVLGVVIVCALNQVLLVIFQVLISWERLCTVTDVTQSQMIKLFLSQFVNTGLLMLLVNMSLTDAPEWMHLLNVLRIGAGTYTDVSAAWFVAVGTSLLITIAMQVFSTTIPPLIMSFVVNPILIRIYSWRTVTEDVLCDVYVYPEWNLALRLAQTLNVVYCIMLYSAGMPVLYLVGVAYCSLAYWLDKWCLLRGSKRPPCYNEKVIESAMHMFPVAALLHTLFALWTYGKQDLFPSDWSLLTNVFEAMLGVSRAEYAEIILVAQSGTEEQRKANFFDYIMARLLDFSREGCWLLLVIFSAFFAYYIIHCAYLLVLQPFFKPCMMVLQECCSSCCHEKTHIDRDALTGGTFTEAKPTIEQRGLLTSYSLAASKRYRDAYIALTYKVSGADSSAEQNQDAATAAAANSSPPTKE